MGKLSKRTLPGTASFALRPYYPGHNVRTLYEVILNRILRVIHGIDVPAATPRKVWMTLLTSKSSNVTLGSCHTDRFILMIA